MVVKALLFSLVMLGLGVILSLLMAGIIKVIYMIIHRQKTPESGTE